MTVSTTTAFSLNKRTLIETALSMAGVRRSDNGVSADDYNHAETLLAGLLSHWQAQGLNQHQSDMVTLVLEPNVFEYKLGTTAHCTETLYETTLAADAISGATTITVVDAAGFAVNSVVGVFTGTAWHWTTITVVASNSVTLAAALPVAVNNNAAVYSYAAKIPRPLRVKSAYRKELTGTNPCLTIEDREAFFQHNENATHGATVQVFYEPTRDVAGKFYVFPMPSSNSPSKLLLHVQRPAFLPQANADTLDIPQDWYLATLYNLAAHCVIHWNKSNKNADDIRMKAAELYDEMRSADTELDTHITFNPPMVNGLYY